MMGTSFDSIYTRFLSQISTYELHLMEDEDLEENLKEWLLAAIPHFQNCKKDLGDYDDNNNEFNSKLDNAEISILAEYMVFIYVRTFLMREENLSQALNSKDYRMYSPQGQLKALTSLQEHISKEANTLKSQYSWSPSSIRERFKSDN